MPHTQQAKKRLRQDEKRRIQRRSLRREISTLTKRFAAHVEDNEREEAEATFRAIASKLDKAAKRGVYHKNTVARRKSQAALRLQALEG